MLLSLTQGGNESKLESWAEMSKSEAVPSVLVSIPYYKNRTLLYKIDDGIQIFLRTSTVGSMGSGMMVAAP